MSEAGFYHVMARGTGRQIIFECDGDRRVFLHLLQKTVDLSEVRLHAYCLMDNHFHLLVHADLQKLAECMQKLSGGYARWLNAKAGRVGHLFQERFKSEAIDDEAYLLTVVRYIHENPKKGGLCETNDYPWSSYGEYVGNSIICDTRLVLELCGGIDAFKRFHVQNHDQTCCLDNEARYGKYTKDEAALFKKAEDILGDVPSTDVKTFSKPRRDALLKLMKTNGLSIRQIERLTGIGRNTIARA